jgi:hypothetical protein
MTPKKQLQSFGVAKIPPEGGQNRQNTVLEVWMTQKKHL